MKLTTAARRHLSDLGGNYHGRYLSDLRKSFNISTIFFLTLESILEGFEIKSKSCLKDGFFFDFELTYSHNCHEQPRGGERLPLLA